MRVRPVFVFNILAILFLIVSIFLYIKFANTKTMVIKTNFKREIAYVKNISNNIINYIDHKNLYDPKVRNEIEKTLSLFVTNRYKYIYIVDRSNKEYRFLVDGSKEDKASFLEPYEPYEIKEWNRVFQTIPSIEKNVKNIDTKTHTQGIY